MVPRACRPHRIAAASAIACAVLFAVAPPAAAQSVTEVNLGGDAVTGDLPAPGDVDRIPFRAVDGAVISIALKAAKGSALLPAVDVIGVDLEPDGGMRAAFVTSRKGNAVTLKNFPVTGTGLRYIEIRGRDGTTGSWSLRSKVRLPKGFAAAGQLEAGVVSEVPFTCPGNATATVVAKAAKGAAAVPEFVGLLDPTGQPVLADDVVPSKTGFVLPGLLLGKPGTYLLRLRAASAAGFSVAAKWKIPAPFKRALTDAQIRVLPVLRSLTPSAGTLNQAPLFRLEGRFLRPGVVVRFRKPPTVVGTPASAISVDDDGASFIQSLASFQRGVYDVEAENPDGGLATIPQALEVLNAPAVLASITPNFGYDTEVARTTITGSFLNAGAAVSLEADGDAIPGTVVSGSGSVLQVDFDLRGRALGYRDLVVVNPDAPGGRLEDAFQIRNPPPRPEAITPGDDLGGDLVVATVTGQDFDPGASVRLRRTGQPDVVASSVTFVSAGEVRADLDVSGTALGAWDVVVTNGDGGTGTLPGGFRRSSVARAAEAFAPGGPFTAPPPVVAATDIDAFAMAWVETNSAGTTWEIKVRLLDDEGRPAGDAVSVSEASSSTLKRDADIAWSPERGEYLVTWSEHVSVNVPSTSKHPSGSGTMNLLQVVAQRLDADDLTLLGKNVRISDGAQFPAASGWVLEHFDNFRPRAVWDFKRDLWQIVFTQRWDTSGLYSYDDFDVILRSLNPATGAVGDLGGTSGACTNIASAPYHEGDASIAWDPTAAEVLVVYGARGGSDTAPKDLHLGRGGAGAYVLSGGGADVADARAVVDAASSRVLLTWTRVPASGGRTVHAAALDRSSLAVIGSAVAVAGSSGEHFLARAAGGATSGEAMIAWSRTEPGGDHGVRVRRVSVAGNGGVTLLGTEAELAGGSGDEACASITVDAAGDYAAFWAKSLTLVRATLPAPGFFPGAAVPAGEYRGTAVWTARVR